MRLTTDYKYSVYRWKCLATCHEQSRGNIALYPFMILDKIITMKITHCDISKTLFLSVRNLLSEIFSIFSLPVRYLVT